MATRRHARMSLRAHNVYDYPSIVRRCNGSTTRIMKRKHVSVEDDIGLRAAPALPSICDINTASKLAVGTTLDHKIISNVGESLEDDTSPLLYSRQQVPLVVGELRRATNYSVIDDLLNIVVSFITADHSFKPVVGGTLSQHNRMVTRDDPTIDDGGIVAFGLYPISITPPTWSIRMAGPRWAVGICRVDKSQDCLLICTPMALYFVPPAREPKKLSHPAPKTNESIMTMRCDLPAHTLRFELDGNDLGVVCDQVGDWSTLFAFAQTLISATFVTL